MLTSVSELLDPVLRSLRAATWAAATATPLAFVLGHWLARANGRVRLVLTSLALLPLALPPVVTGYLLLALLGRHGPLGVLGVPFHFSAVVVAAAVVSFPLAVLGARAAFDAVPRRYEEVAWSLGLSPGRVLWRVTLPLAARGLSAAALLAFVRALGEFGATAVLAGNVQGETRTLALAVYTALQQPGGETAAAWLAAGSVAVALLAAAVHEWGQPSPALREQP